MWQNHHIQNLDISVDLYVISKKVNKVYQKSILLNKSILYTFISIDIINRHVSLEWSIIGVGLYPPPVNGTVDSVNCYSREVELSFLN